MTYITITAALALCFILPAWILAGSLIRPLLRNLFAAAVVFSFPVVLWFFLCAIG